MSSQQLTVLLILFIGQLSYYFYLPFLAMVFLCNEVAPYILDNLPWGIDHKKQSIRFSRFASNVQDDVLISTVLLYWHIGVFCASIKVMLASYNVCSWIQLLLISNPHGKNQGILFDTKSMLHYQAPERLGSFPNGYVVVWKVGKFIIYNVGLNPRQICKMLAQII